MQFPVKSEVLSLLTRVSDLLAAFGVDAYLVGGFVRDALLKRATADIDIAVSGDALDIASRFATDTGGHYVLLDEQSKVGRVVLSPWQLDFSSFSGTIAEDLSRRDFTINAMAVSLSDLLDNPKKASLLDPFQGRSDLKKRVIRTVRDGVFTADPVRLLRAFRLSAELGFAISDDMKALIQRDAHLVASVAGERVHEELVRLLAVHGMAKHLFLLSDTGLLTALIPELAEAEGVTQPPEHHWDVFQHSLRTVETVEFLLHEGDWEHGEEGLKVQAPWSTQLEEHFAQEVSSGSTRGSILKLSALLHDIAKPQTKTIEDTGRMRFLGHQEEGADVVVAILERLRFSSKEIKLVETSVRHHLRPTQMSHEGLPTSRAIYRYFRDTGDAGIDILFLSLADHLAARGPTLIPVEWQKHVHVVEYMLAQYFETKTVVAPVKLVDGNDLVNIFGLSPGPRIGLLLEQVREAQAAGEITTRDEALSYVREHLGNKVG